jgi:thiol:disulfide interchange protein DsbD
VLLALIGGVVLNLMPCVFPILSLKALSFAGRGGDRAGMRRDGLIYASGVVITFLAVAGLLMGVRASGAQVGWGYQLQSPAVVAALAALMFVIGLVLAGVFELGTSLTRLGGLGGSGEGSAFLTGVLATVVATPCTAPFMGAAVGAALVRPAVEGLIIFGALGIGMAAPYVALCFWPALTQRLPRPGRWMETFKQVLAFPMFGVAIWLVWVFGLQTGMGGATRLLFGLLLLAFAGWLIGRWPATVITTRKRWATRALATCAVATALVTGIAATTAETTPAADADDSAAVKWEPWSAAAIDEHRNAGRAVFVDFTAAWCISCQVNERVALDAPSVRQAFAERDVALMKADWTRRDANITSALATFGRSGVPLYVYYPANRTAEPVVLPALLTPAIVLNLLEKDG